MADDTADDNVITQVVKPKQPLNLLQALALRQRGLSLREIATQLGVPHSTIALHFRKLGNLLDTPQKIQVYESGRANLLTSAEAIYLDSVMNADLSETSAKDKAVIYGILYDKGRLERGKATAHVAVLAGLIAQADKVMFVSKPVVSRAIPVPEPEVKAANDAESSHVIADDSISQQVIASDITCDTPSTPNAGGTGGLAGERVAVDAHDLQVVQSAPDIHNDNNEFDDTDYNDRVIE